jgi:hypothetical protein
VAFFGVENLYITAGNAKANSNIKPKQQSKQQPKR